MQNVIFVPGLGDKVHFAKLVTKLWKSDEICIFVFDTQWKSKETFVKKLARLIRQIDTLSKNDNKISLIGMSAGGSLVINAYAQRKDKIHKLITVSSRLLKGKEAFPSLSLASLGFPSFKESVTRCEVLLASFRLTNKAKLMTTQSLLYDGIVPLSTMTIPGIKNLKIPIPFHSLSIAATLTIYRKQIINFLA